MGKTLIYMRVGRGLPTIEQQRATVRRAGVVDPEIERSGTYIDTAPRKPPTRKSAGLPERDFLTKALRVNGGDVIYVPSLAVLGVGASDSYRVMEEWASRGATIRVIAEGLTLDPAGVAWIKAGQKVEKAAGRRRTDPARAAKAKRARLAHPEQAAGWARAAEMWPNVLEHTIKEIVAASGISSSTLYRAARNGLLPKRNAQPFGASQMIYKVKKAKR